MFHWRTFDPEILHGEALLRIKTEVATDRDRLDELLKHKGQSVLIHGSEIIGYFKTREAASRAASRAFGPSPVLIKKVAEQERIVTIGAGVIVCQSWRSRSHSQAHGSTPRFRIRRLMPLLQGCSFSVA